MAVTYYTSLAEALPVVNAVVQKAVEIEQQSVQGQVVFRDLVASDLGLSSWLLAPSGGASTVTIVANYQIPSKVTIGIFGFAVDTFGQQMSVEYVDLYVGGSRVRRWSLSPAQANKQGGVMYLSAEESIILTDNSQITLVAVVNNPIGSGFLKLAVLGVVAEPLGRTIILPTSSSPARTQ